YGSYFDEFEGFLQTVANRSQDDRLYRTEFAQDFFVDGCEALLAEPDMPEPKRVRLAERLAELKAATA
ncbi:MAG: hypothetical protein ACYTFO_02435, partial [Planctomycetota bacterium]